MMRLWFLLFVRWDVARLLLLLLLLLLLFLLALHLFHDLLRGAYRAARAKARPQGRRDGDRLNLVIDSAVRVVVILTLRRLGPCDRGRIAGLAGAEYDLKRRPVGLIADHQQVVAGTLQELRQNIAQ